MLTTTSSLIAILSLLFITLAAFISPVLAQPTMSSIGGSRGMDFASMNFANSMLNGSSLFGTVGMSTGVNLLQNDEISVTLSHTITTAGNARSLPGSVTIMAMRVPMNLRDLMSIAAAAASNKTAANNSNSNNLNIIDLLRN